ncbi:MAG: NERD domain-containing protein [Gammaproteobacteria bacterium]|nr:NERD domain-containing protein [Gammaproteobacteria bacterium]
MPDILRFDYLSPDAKPWVLSAVTLLLLAFIWLVVHLVRRRRDRLRQAFNAIGFDRIEGLIIPSVDDGEIQIDQLLLTSGGLLIVDIKDVQGVVFGSDKMQDWTVINNERRYTFSNPQPALYDRIAAVRQIVQNVPVSGRVLFLDGAEFAKSVPSKVCGLDELVDEFGETDKHAARNKIDAFMPHWDLVRSASVNLRTA